MYIITGKDDVTNIYPYTDDATDTAFTARVTISQNGNVYYNGEPFTPEEVAQLKAAFDKAFEIVAEQALALDPPPAQEERR